MKKLALLLGWFPLGVFVAVALAFAQSSPNWPTGYNPTTAEINAAFAAKLDSGNGTFTGLKVGYAPGGTLLLAVSSSGQPLNGIDFTPVSFTGFFLKSLGFTVDGTGDVSAVGIVANGAVSLNPQNAHVTISPTGTGGVTIAPSGSASVIVNPTVPGTLDNVVIGSSTPAAGHFTAVSATSGAVDGVVIGSVTPAAGHFTTLSASTNSASSQKQVTGPTAPASTSAFTMQGLAGSIIPATTGTVLLTINGSILNTSGTQGVGISYQISYGTGAAPTNGAALAGTQIGATQLYENPTTVTAAAVVVPFSTTAVVTGLTPGTTYWIDLAAKSLTTASAASLSNVNVAAVEIR